MTRPTIGDFRGPARNSIRSPPPPAAPAASAQTATDSATEGSPENSFNLEAALQDTDFLTPAESYRARLKEMKVELVDAQTIYDAVLSKGFYEEYVRLRGDHRAVFRTRMYDDHLRLQTVLEMKKPQLAISQDELITRYNMAASLYEWDGKALKHENDDDFDAVLRLVTRLPGPVFTVLSRELSKFDAKVMAVFSEGAEANF